MDLAGEVTVFVTTVGDEPNFQECIARLRGQSAGFQLEVIRNVAPLSAALQKMIDQCRTPYYVQVDEDMLLFPEAVLRLYQTITTAAASVPLVCAPLWDCDVNATIYGIKIYRHAIVRRFPYEDTFSCEKTQVRRMYDAGHEVLLLPMDGRESCLGEHGRHYTPETIFARWRRVFHKQRRYATLPWVEAWPARLLERYMSTRDTLHLYAFLGAVAGLTGELPPDRENDFRVQCPDFARLAQYFPVGDGS